MKALLKKRSILLAVGLSIFTLLPSFGLPNDPTSWIPWRPGTELWEYNPGPDPETAHGKALLDLFSEFPDFMPISEELMDTQKFRYIDGITLARIYFFLDYIKMVVIGQDGAPVTNIAKMPGTSGFGARVQSIGNYFGVDQGVATTNAYSSTIKGQYGSFDHPYVEVDSKGLPKLRKMAYVDNEFWMLSNGRDSEILLKREAFWEWIIKNNPESLRLMVLFGGAARDAWAEFLIARGAKVGTRFNEEQLKSVQIPESKLAYAGGNNVFPVPIDRNGQDIYEILLGRKLDYSKPAAQLEAFDALESAGQRGLDMMVFTGGGINGSGIVNVAQLGGYDLDDVVINGEKTNSIKGLILSDGYVVKEDIAFAMSAHPSSLSRMTPDQASAALRKSFAKLEPLKKKGWKIEPDLDASGRPLTNRWHEGKDYEYGRADIRQGYFEFGAPDDRRVSRADASRMDPQTIIAGSRGRVKFDQRKISAAKERRPSETLDPRDNWTGRARQKETRYIFDRGPGQETARLLMTSIDREALFEPKPGMKTVDRNGNDITFKTHGIDAYYTKTHPDTGLFGFHRGDFDSAKVLILADPHGIDDWITSRALTGERGQYLNGLMDDLGYGADYLVLKTVPVGMDGATADEWEVVRKRTEEYREVAIQRALENPKIEVIFTDGEIARAEMDRVLRKLKIQDKVVISITRDGDKASSGLAQAAEQARRSMAGLAGRNVKVRMKDIPRSHLPWTARLWEGTGGDSVVDALGKERGGVRAVATPNWVVRQKLQPTEAVKVSIERLRSLLEQAGTRLGNEDIREFIKRKNLVGGGSFTAVEKARLRLGVTPIVDKMKPDPRCRDLLDFPSDIPITGT